MRVVPYTPEHMEHLMLQPSQAIMRPFMMKPGYAQSLAIPGKSFTALEGDRVLVCGGIVPVWEGRGEAWALLSDDLSRQFISIHRAAVRLLDASGLRRVEATADADFCEARQWLEMLGFECEGPLRAFTPDGRDALRYARVR